MPAMAKRTTGYFTPALFRFLRDLDRNNERDWFRAHRDRYEADVRAPMLAFITDVAAGLRRISPHIVADPSPVGGSMFRPNRDIRFSNDKRPYKTYASAQFRHDEGRDVHAPGYYLHLGLDEVFVGTGIWRPDGPGLARIRAALREDPARWRRVVSAKAFRETMRLGGESLKRAPRGFDAEHPLIDDIKRKDFIAVADLDEKAVCAPDFATRFVAICRTGRPFMAFLAESLGVAW